MHDSDLWLSADRRLGKMIDKLDKSISSLQKERIYNRAEQNWKQTLDKLWPLKSKEKPSSLL